jgi:hypothetical protein
MTLVASGWSGWEPEPSVRRAAEALELRSTLEREYADLRKKCTEILRHKERFRASKSTLDVQRFVEKSCRAVESRRLDADELRRLLDALDRLELELLTDQLSDRFARVWLGEYGAPTAAGRRRSRSRSPPR